jgi:hypothetical protein
MEKDLEKCVIIVDFTKWGMVINGNVHCFVVCVLFGEEKTGILMLNHFYVCIIFLFAGLEWKPSIKYFDFFGQSTKEGKVRQVFPFVKVDLYFIFYFFLLGGGS